METVDLAAQYGHIDILDYCLENGCPFDIDESIYYYLYIDEHYDSTFRELQERSLKVYKWLHQHSIPWDVEAGLNAAREGHLETLMWAIENGCPWHEDILGHAFGSYNMPMVEYCLEHHSPTDTDIYVLAMNKIGNSNQRRMADVTDAQMIAMLQKIHDYGIPWSRDIISCAERRDRSNVASWLRCHQLRNFVIADPDHDLDILEDKKRELARPDLVAAGIPVFYDKSKQESRALVVPPAIVDPENCNIMISFNNGSTGEDAEVLCNFLNSKGSKTFCTRVFCPNNMGDWRTYTVTGANKCKILIALMTDGWQKSNEFQFEMDIIKNRFAKKEVTVIPVLYNSVDYYFDAEKKHFYRTTFGSYQGIPSKEKDEDWMDSILKLLSS
ncbi:hypothetical protein CTEN210_09136 [Chaetoceros tenuissimus]|uniref:TIR domain-containing protein n=1 Tax=Chaetoceros tenuissimus TaxID=426638 RepID=A0AAD3CXB5_9STRA|nr:hypothetical protein CTEN210_09136 [Chaetoceros tenuissimus]